MADIRDPAQIAAKWVRNASNAAPNYADGVSNPRRPWKAAAASAAPNWNAAVTAAASANRFLNGINSTAEETQRQAALSKGTNRYPEGVAQAEGKYAARFAPYAQVIRSVQLPPRGPRGAAQNLQRVAAIATALNQRRVGGGGGGGR